MKLILLNGAPRSGKDTAAQLIVNALTHFDSLDRPLHVKLSKLLKDCTHRFYGLCDVAHDYFEHRKDEPNETLHGLTPRQAYINMSELLIKPVHGKGFLGAELAKRLGRQDEVFGPDSSRTAVISDCGFVEECEELVKLHPEAILIRLHRPGYGWENDSRGPVSLNHLKVLAFDVNNDGDTDRLEEKLKTCIRRAGLWS